MATPELHPEEVERRLQISLRMKAARHLAGHLGRKGATAMPIKDLVRLGPMLDEKITKNQLEEAEQMKSYLTRTEMQAYIAALDLPAEWFDGLYPSNRGEAVTGPLAVSLRAITEAVRELRRAREADLEAQSQRGPRAVGEEAGDA